MRIIGDKENRLQHTLSTIEYFMSNEYNYYANNNIRKFEFDGEEYNAMCELLGN